MGLFWKHTYTNENEYIFDKRKIIVNIFELFETLYDAMMLCCRLHSYVWQVYAVATNLISEYIIEPKISAYFNCIQYILFSSFRMLNTQSAISLCTYPCVVMHSMQCACVVSLWQHGVLQTMLSYTHALIVRNMNGNCFIYIDVYIFMVFILHWKFQ